MKVGTQSQLWRYLSAPLWEPGAVLAVAAVLKSWGSPFRTVGGLRKRTSCGVGYHNVPITPVIHA